VVVGLPYWFADKELWQASSSLCGGKKMWFKAPSLFGELKRRIRTFGGQEGGALRTGRCHDQVASVGWPLNEARTRWSVLCGAHRAEADYEGPTRQWEDALSNSRC
jgi:hypothetical protein